VIPVALVVEEEVVETTVVVDQVVDMEEAVAVEEVY
jgi:hypothetical protein